MPAAQGLFALLVSLACAGAVHLRSDPNVELGNKGMPSYSPCHDFEYPFIIAFGMKLAHLSENLINKLRYEID